MLPLGDLLRSLSIEYHLYADDSQIYISFKPVLPEQELTFEKLENCIQKIRQWMKPNFLMLNDDKTEFLITGTSQQLVKVTCDSITVGNTVVKASESARNLGVIFNSTMDMKEHIANQCRSMMMHLRNILHIRCFINTEATESLIHALITSRLDYCNSLLYGVPQCELKKLQMVQNTAARIVSKKKKFEHITPIMMSLHWLPVESRITFKVLMITFKALHSQAPKYIQDLIERHTSSRSLRSSSDTNMLVIPRTKLVTGGDSSFSAAAPRLWNLLPKNIRDARSVTKFKCLFKTHLFKIHYKV